MSARRALAHAILTVVAGLLAVPIGANARGDWQLKEPFRDFAVGVLVVGGAAAVEWAVNELAPAS